MSAVWAEYKSLDWLQDSGMVRVCLTQLMVGFMAWSQGSLRMMFSHPQSMT